MNSLSLTQRLQTLFFTYRSSILITYSLTFLENLFELLYPFVIGITIDGLLAGDYTSLIILAGTWLIHTITGVYRNIYDTRTFTRIYSNVVTVMVLEQEKQGTPTSQIVARSALSREFVDFFEQNIPQIITAIFGFFGALVMLSLYDLQIALYCLLLLLPLSLINCFYARKSLIFNRKLNSQLEQEVDILTDCYPEAVQTHYQHLSKLRVRLSNAAAANWGIMELFIIALFMGILVRTATLNAVQPGSIYAILSYAWNYRQSLDIVPTLVQQVSRLKDIGDRMTTIQALP
jgi:ABC-type multidrug transport system fused ATPase/permease subunit